MTEQIITPLDMPKLESPFIRVQQSKKRFLCTPEINPECEWVFTASDVIATEKLDGTNVSVIIQDGEVIEVYNRKTKIPLDSVNDYHLRILDGIKASLSIPMNAHYYHQLPNGQYFGELIGEKIQNNDMKVSGTFWVPFNAIALKYLVYPEFNNIDRNYESIRNWLQNNVRSKFFKILHGVDGVLSEGIVFHRESTGQMAKLRHDMFDYWYDNPSHKSHKEIDNKCINNTGSKDSQQ